MKGTECLGIVPNAKINLDWEAELADLEGYRFGQILEFCPGKQT